MLRRLLKKAGIIGISVAMTLSAMPMNTVFADSPTGDQAPIQVRINTVQADEVGSVVYYGDPGVPDSDREEDYTATDYAFFDAEHKIEFDPDDKGTRGRDLSHADFEFLYMAGTDKAALEAVTAETGTWVSVSPSPSIQHVSESTYFRILVRDNNGIFSPAMSRVYAFNIIPAEVELDLDDLEKEWGETDPQGTNPADLCDYETPREIFDADAPNIIFSVRRKDDETNTAENRENVGNHNIVVHADKTALGANASDYNITDGRAILSITSSFDDRSFVDASHIEGYYNKEPYGIETDETLVPAGYAIEYKYSDDGTNWTTVANVADANVINANVASDGSGNGRQVKVVITGTNGASITYGPYAIKVKKIPLTVNIRGNLLSWDKSDHNGNDPSPSQIKALDDDDRYVYIDAPEEERGNVSAGKYLVDGDTFTFDVALAAGSYSAGNTYERVISFSNCKVMAGGINNSANYEITPVAGNYKPTNEILDALEGSFSVEGFNTIYDGKDHYVIASGYTDLLGRDLDANLTYETSADNGKTWSAPVAFNNTSVSMKNVGNMKVRVTASLSGTNGSVSKTVDTIITKKAASVNAQAASKKKGQEDPPFTATTQGFIPGEEPVSGSDYTVSRDTTSDPDPEKTGTHTGVIKVTFTTKEAAKWKNYDISTKNADFKITDLNTEKLNKITVTGYRGVYDGNYHTVNHANVPEGTAITYSLDNGNTWVDEKPSFKDTTLSPDGTTATAKTVRIKFTLEDESVTKDTTVLISRKTAYIRVAAASKKENEPDPEWTAAVSGVVNDEKFDYTIVRTDAGDNTVGTHKGVLVPQLNAEYPNYSIHLVSNALTITRGADYDEVQKFSVKGWSGTYDGTSHSVTIKTAVDGSEVTYSTEENGSYTSTKPSVKHVKDSTTVYVKCTKGSYEKIVKTELTVKRRNAAITVNNATKMQGDPMPEFSAYTDNLAKHDKIDFNLSCSASDSVGTHTGAIKCTVVGEYPDYTITVRNGSLTVTKKTEDTTGGDGSSTPTAPSDNKRKGETTTGDDSKNGTTPKDKVTKGEVVKEDGDSLELIDRSKYLIGPPTEYVSQNVARFAAPSDGLEKVIYEGEPKSISRNASGNEAAAHKAKAGSAAPYVVGALVAGAIAVGMGVTGAWSILWLLLLGLLFKKKRKHWKGLLTYENNMFIKINGDTEGVEDMQDIINKGVSVEELRALMSGSNVETILPAKTQMTIDVDGEGEQTYEADEDKFYEVLGNATGKHVIATIFNTLGKFSMTVEMDCK